MTSRALWRSLVACWRVGRTESAGELRKLCAINSESRARDSRWTRRSATTSAFVRHMLSSPPLPHNHPATLTLSGLCTEQDNHEGVYTLSGAAANGAPIYRKEDNGYFSLYYDLDCNDSGRMPARWILDRQLPDASRDRDLDNDGRCS